MTSVTGAVAPSAPARAARWWRHDLLLLPVLGLLDLFTASSVVIQSEPVGPARQWLQVLAAVLSVGALWWRARAPVAVFAFECVHGVAMWFLLHDYRPWAGLIVALYTVAALRPLVVSAAAYAAACARSLLSAFDSFRVEPSAGARAGEFVVTALMFALIYAAAWAAGSVVRRHRRRVAQLERERRVARAEAVALERRRIAAELHDVVSHSVTVMVLQAAGAARISASDPERTREALLHIQQAGQQAMAELRRLLAVMRAESGPVGDGEPGPQPRLDDIEVLLTSMRCAGLTVTMSVSGSPRPLDPSIELAAYRTVQESLTNTLKHVGRRACATVHFGWQERVLLLRVDDDGSGREPGAAAGLSTGNGLASLAERLERVGGRLVAGPRAEGGFRVSATLPVAQHGDLVAASGDGGAPAVG
ncbi:histidine kinase [Micromonospora chalcea]|uniref:sensor histidine kinase n=1 Tax=Micromonospora TaxID=1873 RepID=UPI000DE8EE50|nr:histidine kinase [Micromonospora sp. LHW51205]RBQ06069.1 sensor histidine kinase [Micromonospora sp. LHW51205]